MTTMARFFIGHDLNGIEKVTQDSGELALLARGGGTEVMIQKINSDRTFSIYPSDQSDVMEFFFVLEGNITTIVNGEEKHIKKGNYFYVYDLHEVLTFNTKSKATLLYISSLPMFYLLSNQIRAMTKIVEQVEGKDYYTHNHSSRVQNYSIKIAEKLHLRPEKIDDIAWAGILHDIGKINIPDEILNKPGRLTPEEFAIIKTHPSEGKRMIEGTLLEYLSEIIAQHHERLDGSGYPQGLKGDNITLGARIIAVADSFDAMTTDRPYKKAMHPRDAITELKSLAGIQFDPKVVAALEEILKEEDKL
ncbi:MAG: HD-GYP domain-containing protein [Bacillota bacterium]|jgi:putative nucleotidyltransferase with HDIG domain